MKLNTRRTEDMSAIRLGGLEIRSAGDWERGSLSTSSRWITAIIRKITVMKGVKRVAFGFAGEAL